MKALRMAGLLSAGLVALLLCLGLGWGPAEATASPERLALLGLALAGLAWPALLLGLLGYYRQLELPGAAPAAPVD